jgi:arylsulfatase
MGTTAMRVRITQTAARLLAVGILFGGFPALAREAVAQEKSGRPAASGQLPKPDPVFQGKIGETINDSAPDYPQPLKAPKRAPNVLLILVDDARSTRDPIRSRPSSRSGRAGARA